MFNPRRIILSGDGGNGSGPKGPFGYTIMTVEDGQAIANGMLDTGIEEVELWGQDYGGNEIQPPSARVRAVWKEIIKRLT